MKKSVLVLLLAMVFVLGSARESRAQFTAEEIAEREKWEEFLAAAEIVAQQQMVSREAVTSPWILTLEKDGVRKRALWKNPEGRLKGFLENWKWEIAAYRLDKYLGLHMVPPTVEKRFRGNRGSCQLWVEDATSLRDIMQKDIKKPSYKIYPFNLALYLQRAFDNLIANEDRHQNQFLVTDDWRMILIDHSRTFRTTKKFTASLIYDEKYKEGPRLMSELPRAFYEKLKSLTPDVMKEIVGEYLTAGEIDATLLRRDLIVQWVENRIKQEGEDKVLYEAK
jgi:hypothetical protein